MISLTINGITANAERGTTILEAARFLGFPIPTLCHMEGLTPYGACRLCVVEIGESNPSLVSSCTYQVSEGLKVRTASNRVLKARRMVIELMLASAPQSKTIQDLAAQHAVKTQRFRQEYEDCILCGLCTRMCKEQMMASAIGFNGRGETRDITTPFDVKSQACRQCGGCIHVCPVCSLRCTYNEPEKAICGGCANLAPPCADKEPFDDMMCYMAPCVACEISDDPKPEPRSEAR